MFAKSPKYFFYFIYFAILSIVAIHFILNLGLSYTDINGCYRAYTLTSGTLLPSTSVVSAAPIQPISYVLSPLMNFWFSKRLAQVRLCVRQLDIFDYRIDHGHPIWTCSPFLDHPTLIALIISKLAGFHWRQCWLLFFSNF